MLNNQKFPSQSPFNEFAREVSKMMEDKLKKAADKLPLPETTFKTLTEKTVHKQNTHTPNYGDWNASLCSRCCTCRIPSTTALKPTM